MFKGILVGLLLMMVVTPAFGNNSEPLFYPYKSLYMFQIYTEDAFGPIQATINYSDPDIYFPFYVTVLYEFDSTDAKENEILVEIVVRNKKRKLWTDSKVLLLDPGQMGITYTTFELSKNFLPAGYYTVEVRMNLKGVGSQVLRTNFRVITNPKRR